MAAEVGEGGVGVDGVPADDGVGERGEAFALEVLVIGGTVAEPAEVGEEQVASQGVEGFAFVELGVYPSAVVGVVEVLQQGDGLDDPAVLLDGLGELILARGGLEAGDEQRRGEVAMADGRGDAEHVVPAGDDPVGADGVAEQIGGGGAGGGVG